MIKTITSILIFVGVIWVLSGIWISTSGLNDLVAVWAFFGGIGLFMIGIVGKIIFGRKK